MAHLSGKELVEDTAGEIIKHIGLDAKISVEKEKNSFSVEIEGENLGALIGYHGENLNSFQLILSLVVNRKLGEGNWQRVVVDVGNWRSERSQILKEMVERAIEQMKESGQEQISLPSMNPSERREIHILVSEQFPDYESFSKGEGAERRIFLKKKSVL